jgi:hypothetical protein
MLLETLDIKKNDIIIYSQNIFDLEKNFKIIFKDDEKRLSRNINYKDVCNFVDEFTPKNLIIYRLLTNLPDFKIDPSSFGFILNINNKPELIYFDTVYAIRELECYCRDMNMKNLRFRIQQVGLTTLTREGNLPNYAEIYAIDLEAMEARYQNDKVFVDAIMAVSSSKNHRVKNPANSGLKDESNGEKKSLDKLNTPSFADEIKQSKEDIITEIKGSPGEIRQEVNEDKDFDLSQFMKLNLKGNTLPKETAETKKLEKSKGEEKPISFSEFLKKKMIKDKSQKNIYDNKDLMNIFKSSVSLKEYIASREDKKIFLRLDRRQPI